MKVFTLSLVAIGLLATPASARMAANNKAGQEAATEAMQACAVYPALIKRIIKAVTAACVVLGLMAGSSRAAEYEYKLLDLFDIPPTAAELNEVAKDGWRVFQIVTRSDTFYVYLVRERSLPVEVAPVDDNIPRVQDPEQYRVVCYTEEPNGRRSRKFYYEWPIAKTFPDDWTVDCKRLEALKPSPEKNMPSLGFPSNASFGWDWYQERWELAQMMACIEHYSDEHGLTDLIPQEALDACQ